MFQMLLEQMLDLLLRAQPQERIGLVAFSLFLLETMRPQDSLKHAGDMVDVFRSFIEQAISAVKKIVIGESADDRFIKSKPL